MLFPFIAWAITGVFFFIKPGYSQAYERLQITGYPNITSFQPAADNEWSEIKIIRSILGEHLLVKNKDDDWIHLNKKTMELVQAPSPDQVELLIKDAIKEHSKRYGVINDVDGLVALTSNQIKITLNWDRMTLHQQGSDTEFIDMMYRIHYLQWTGIKIIDNVLGIIGLALMIVLAGFGLLLGFKGSTSSDKKF